MRIAIIGGSNSVVADGYVGRFARHLQRINDDPITIQNIAIGGTMSLTAIGRLHEIDPATDVIIFEYSLNDTGHLNHRRGGAQNKQFLLDLMFHAAAQQAPNATIIPLILASEPFYSTDIDNSVYDEEVSWYRKHGIPYVDMRAWLFETFGWPAPPFLYSDNAHFHRGCAVGMIGALLAERVNAEWQRAPRLSRFSDPFFSSCMNSYFTSRFISADQIAKLNGRTSSLREVKNSRISSMCLQMNTGDEIQVPINCIPVALALTSDNSHAAATISTNTNSAVVSTLYKEIPKGKFIYSSIPLIFIEREGNFLFRDNTDSLHIKVPKSFNRGDVLAFDGFEENLPNNIPGNTLSIAGVLTLKQLD